MDEKQATRDTAENALRAMDKQDGGNRASSFQTNNAIDDFASNNPYLFFALALLVIHIWIGVSTGWMYWLGLVISVGIMRRIANHAEAVVRRKGKNLGFWDGVHSFRKSRLWVPYYFYGSSVVLLCLSGLAFFFYVVAHIVRSSWNI